MKNHSTDFNNFQGATRAGTVYRLIASAGTYDNPISQRDLSSVTGLDPREIRRAVETLRRSGHKILSSRDRTRPGYWLANSPAEFHAFANTVTKMSLAALRTLSRMKVPEDQPGLPFEGE